MENKRYQGDNLDGAISEACAELGIPSDKLRYKVVQEGSKGLFGLGIIGAKKFVIEIIDGKDSVKSDKKPSVNAEKPNRERTEKPKTEKAKTDNSQNDIHKKPAKTENVDNSDKNAVKSEQKQLDRKNNNKDRFKERPRRFDKEQGLNTADQKPQGRPERRDAESRRKPGAEANNVANAVKSEIKPDNKSEQPVRRYEKTGEVTGDPVKTAEEFLTSLFKSMEMNISYSGEFKSENNELVVNLRGEDMGVLIGKRGQTLDALQYLTSQVVNKHQTAYIRVKIDTENYRERRKETMESLAQNIALKVKKTHKPVALEPMNPYERRIIHSYLQNDKEIITKSEGVEPYRHVIVCPVKKKKSYGQRNRDNVITEETESSEIKLTETIINNESISELKVSDEQVLSAADSKLEFTETKFTEVKLETVNNDNSGISEALSSSTDKHNDNAETAENTAKTEE